MIAKTHLTIDWSNHKVFNEEDSFDSTSEEEDPFINPL